MGGFIAIVFFVGVGVLTWYVVVGRTQMLKKGWEERVLSQAASLGGEVTTGGHYSMLEGKIVKQDGFFSFRALEFPGPTATRAFVMNGVPVEPQIAEKYRFLNTNDWMTVVQARYPTGRGVEFSFIVGAGSDTPGAIATEGALSIYGEEADAERIQSAFSAEARSQLNRAARFSGMSGGGFVTCYTKGVVHDPQQIKAVVAAATQVATHGAISS